MSIVSLFKTNIKFLGIIIVIKLTILLYIIFIIIMKILNNRPTTSN